MGLTPRAVLVDGHDSLVSNHSFGHVFLLICKQYLLVRNLSQRRQLVGAVSNRIGASHYRFDCPVKFTGLFPYWRKNNVVPKPKDEYNFYPYRTKHHDATFSYFTSTWTKSRSGNARTRA